MAAITDRKWRVLATDFDGTIAREGVLAERMVQALQKARVEGLKIVLVTGRELKDFQLLNVALNLFDLVVAENGAVLLEPATGMHNLLAPPPDTGLLEELKRLNIEPLSAGQSIIATTDPHEIAVLESIKKLGLDLTITFNKGWVMVLPPGINKASGLAAALGRLNATAACVAGVGDGENDHALLAQCGLAVAVANAVPALKAKAHFVTQGEADLGVMELIDRLLNENMPEATLPPPNP